MKEPFPWGRGAAKREVTSRRTTNTFIAAVDYCSGLVGKLGCLYNGDILLFKEENVFLSDPSIEAVYPYNVYLQTCVFI